MAILVSDNKGRLNTPGTKLNNSEPLKIGKPLGVELLTFWPGKDIKEWGSKAEILITAQIRTKPQPEAAERRVVLLMNKFPFKKPFAIQDIAGDVIGDSMLFYTKSFEGHPIKMTLRGVEVDGMGDKFYEQAREAFGRIGQLAYFTSAAPYLAAAGVVTRLVNLFERWFARDDRLSTQRVDLLFEEGQNIKHLQAGRYLLWDDHWPGALSSSEIRKGFWLSGADFDAPNLLIDQDRTTEFRGAPYFVIKVSSKERTHYDNYVIGANSARLLKSFGADADNMNIFGVVEETAKAINDANQMKSIIQTKKKLSSATDKERDTLKELLNAQIKNLSDDNEDFVRELIQ